MNFLKNILYLPLGATLTLSIMIGMITPLHAAEENNDLKVQAISLQNKYNSLISLSFTFDQATRTGSRQRVGQGKATFYRYQAPAEVRQDTSPPAAQSVMRWDYTLPDPQVIISDGETLSIYTEKDKQLIRTPAKNLESDITYAFFAGTRSLTDDFTAQPGSNEYMFSSGDDLHTIMLVPREPHNQIRDMQIWFDDQKIIHHLVIRDHFDSVTELNFSNIRVNDLIPGDRDELNRIITFPLPPGTEIISR